MSESRHIHIGVDCGTSGIRAAAIGAGPEILAESAFSFGDEPGVARDPVTWLATFNRVLSDLLAKVDAARVRAIAVDGTSGTLLAVDSAGQVLAPPLMYNDTIDDTDILTTIARVAPPTSAVHGASSALARCIKLERNVITGNDGARLVHQADWLAGQLSGRFDVSDENNALKTGYDAVARQWPLWLEQTGADVRHLPQVVAPGTRTGSITAAGAARFGLASDVAIVAGTTDGCASFIATGAAAAGDGVTALGTTLTVKLLSNEPLYAPEYGIYSHRIGDRWLAGGASNSGGNVLAHFFDSERITELSTTIDTTTDGKLDYYPLLKPGERFPINDRDHAPKMTPRPSDDVDYLKEILAGITAIEAMAYRRLEELGAPRLTSLRTVGGGAGNAAWGRLRQRILNVPFADVLSTQAAVGTALLARQGRGN